MRRIIALAASAAAAVAVLAPAAHAGYSTDGQCGPDGSPALGVVPVDTPAGRFYVDDRNFAQGNGLWLYQESNTRTTTLERKAGTEAVTSTDKVPEGLGEDYDVCTDMQGYTGPADTLIF